MFDCRAPAAVRLAPDSGVADEASALDRWRRTGSVAAFGRDGPNGYFSNGAMFGHASSDSSALTVTLDADWPVGSLEGAPTGVG